MDLEPEGIVPPDADVVVGNDPAVLEIERLLEQGSLEEALRAIDAARRDARGKASDLAFLRGDCLLGLGRARDAEQQFREVLAGDPDCPSSRCWLAMSLFLQWRFEEAELAVVSARELPDALVDADVLLGCLLERRGEYADADGWFERAAAAAPDRCGMPIRMSREEFDAELQLAIRALPDQFRRCLEAVAVVVQDLPDDSFARRSGEQELGPDMLGLFDGVPLTEGDSLDGGSLESGGATGPSTIYLFQRNLERLAHHRDDLVEQIRITLYHELGHYLGFEEGDMEGLGLE